MLKVTEAFGGIGSQRRALQALGIPFKVVEYIDFDKHCVTSYNAIYSENFEPVDITKLERLKQTDLFCYSFPCQDISVAGLGAGIEVGTRSGLLYEVRRLLLQAKQDGWLPKYLLLENVKNLVGKKFKPKFDEWLDFLETLGYETEWFVLNSKDFGMAQNRERVFAVSCLGGIPRKIKPQPIELTKTMADYIDPVVDEKYYYSSETVKKLLENLNNNDFLEREIQQVGNFVTTGHFSNPQRGRVYSINGVSPSLNTVTGGGLEPKILIINTMPDGTCRTLKAQYANTSCSNFVKTGTWGGQAL